MKITIYTANFGMYDTFKPTNTLGYHLYITDQDTVIEGWDTMIVEPRFSNVREARYWKINSHLLGGDYTIWVDASFHIVGDLRELVEGVDSVACYSHGFPGVMCNTGLYDEADVCIEAGLDDKDVIRAQVKRYKEEGFLDDLGLFSSGLIVRKNTPRVKHFNECWWDEVNRGSHRDQLSQVYASWKTGVKIGTIPGCIYKNKYITKTKHANR